MNEELISLFIDNELDLDGKITFVETVHADGDFTCDTIDLLTQEKWIRSEVVDIVPPLVVPERQTAAFFSWKRLGVFASGLTAAMVVVFIGLNLVRMSPDVQGPAVLTPYRFVVYQPDVTKAEVIGSFTGWQPIPMARIDGYWELVMPLPVGEHRYSYVFDGNRKIPDPTVPVRETDDFGGENSILEVRRAI